eukprot:scaffold186080_cov17-Tisochrysis_lutea.AAC.3
MMVWISAGNFLTHTHTHTPIQPVQAHTRKHARAGPAAKPKPTLRSSPAGCCSSSGSMLAGSGFAAPAAAATTTNAGRAVTGRGRRALMGASEPACVRNQHENRNAQWMTACPTKQGLIGL